MNLNNVWAKVPTFYRDLIERAVKTFAQVFVATMLLSAADFAHLPSVAVWQKAASAGLAAGLSVFTSWLSSLKGNPNSASLVSAIAQTPQGGNVPPGWNIVGEQGPEVFVPTVGDPSVATSLRTSAPTTSTAARPEDGPQPEDQHK